MLRMYDPRTDEKELIRLIRTELIPLSHSVHQHDAQVVRELPKRLRSGVTYVVSMSKKSPAVSFIHFEMAGGVLNLDMMATHPKYRNRGYGKSLIAYSEAHGQANSCQAARLFVDQSNEKTHQWYNRLGYKTYHYYPKLRCYELLKPLAPLSFPIVH